MTAQHTTHTTPEQDVLAQSNLPSRSSFFKTFVAATVALASSALLPNETTAVQQAQRNTTPAAAPKQAEPKKVEEGLEVGNKLPDVTLLNRKGEKQELLKTGEGKLMLVDLWATWCPPCRGELPHLVKAYDKFKDKSFAQGGVELGKGFEIFSISIDHNESAWLNSIKNNNLKWDAHVRDSRASKTGALYDLNNTGIPSAFLIDQNGIILAKGGDLRGDGLEKTIAQYVQAGKKDKKEK